MYDLVDRRSFLKVTGTMFAAGALTRQLGAAADADPAPSSAPAPLKKAIMYSTVRVKGTVREKFQAIKDAGFAGVEPMGDMDNDEVMQALNETGLKAASVCCNTHWAKPLSDPNPAVRQLGLEGLQRSLRDAKRYGASSVLFVPAVVSKQVSYDDAYKRSQAGIREVLPLAQELGVKIAIENVWNGFLLSPLEAARYVDEFNSPWVAWHFDIGNIIAFGWPEQWIRILGPRIVKLHIKEYSRKKRDNEGMGKGFSVPFLEGDNDWPVIMKSLAAIKYQGWGIAEQSGGDTLEGLKDLSSRMDKIFAS